MDTKIVTKCGTVDGFKENGLNKWFGIPYAKPPIGDLRFRRAVACEKWTGIKECKRFQAKPVQFTAMQSKKKPTYMIEEEGEDCLYLNIWRRDNEKKKLPVFVWNILGL